MLQEAQDVFQKAKVPSMNKWGVSHKGQHVPLGIAEHNFFLALAAFGLSAQQFGHRLFPVGTLYDPFIARGLDALNYGCYQVWKSPFSQRVCPSFSCVWLSLIHI